MSAFESAWLVLKAPLMVDSIKPQNVKWSSSRKQIKPVARFLDPVTGEEHPMTAEVIGENVHVNIRGTGPYGQKELERAQATFNHDSASFNESPRTYASGGSSTWPQYRKRGYMTAIYDLASILANRKALGMFRRLGPGYLQSQAGADFWEKETGVPSNIQFPTGPYGMPDFPEGTYWPVIEEDRPPVPNDPKLEEERGLPL